MYKLVKRLKEIYNTVTEHNVNWWNENNPDDKFQVEDLPKFYVQEDDAFKEMINYVSVKETHSEFPNIILTQDLNFEHVFGSCDRNGLYPDERYDFSMYAHFDQSFEDERWAYGLSDNLSQLIDKYGTEMLIICVPMIKDHQPESGGFRFHKWGPYIGVNQDEVENTEYLYDTSMNLVYVYEVFDIEKIKKTKKENRDDRVNGR